MENVAWGLDYRKTRKADERRGERWITTLTRLNDGRLLASWESGHRPGYAEVRKVLGFGFAKTAHPEHLWCDEYLERWVAPLADEFGVLVHIRMDAGAVVWRRSQPPVNEESIERQFWRGYFERVTRLLPGMN